MSKQDIFDFVIDARKLKTLLESMYEAGSITSKDYHLIKDQILLQSELLAPDITIDDISETNKEY